MHIIINDDGDDDNGDDNDIFIIIQSCRVLHIILLQLIIRGKY